VKRAAALVAFVAIVGSGNGVSAWGQNEIPLDQYRARLVASLAALRAGGSDPASIQAATDALGLPIAVRLPDGSDVLVTSSTLLGRADQGTDADRLSSTTAALQAALDAADAAATAVRPDRARVDRALSDAYEGLRPVSPSWNDRLMSEVRQTLGWLLDHALGAVTRSGAGSLIGWTIVLAMILGAALLAGRVRRGVVPDARWTTSGDGVDIMDWRRIADDALAADDLSAAVPALYHVLLGTLDARGVVRDAPALTAGECRRAVRRARPALAASIDGATSAFERVAYGKLPAHRHDVDALRDADREVRRS
jgi:hypothetical protein